MIVDTSALVAILTGEPEAEAFNGLIAAADQARVSAATYLETGIVLDRFRHARAGRQLDPYLERLRVLVEPLTPAQARRARLAYQDFGRGSGHPAALNFGDCFSYALAKERDEPLLYKGEDFEHTDVRPAMSRGGG